MGCIEQLPLGSLFSPLEANLGTQTIRIDLCNWVVNRRRKLFYEEDLSALWAYPMFLELAKLPVHKPGAHKAGIVKLWVARPQVIEEELQSIRDVSGIIHIF